MKRNIRRCPWPCLGSSTWDQLFLISVDLNPTRYFGFFYARKRCTGKKPRKSCVKRLWTCILAWKGRYINVVYIIQLAYVMCVVLFGNNAGRGTQGVRLCMILQCKNDLKPNKKYSTIQFNTIQFRKSYNILLYFNAAFSMLRTLKGNVWNMAGYWMW